MSYDHIEALLAGIVTRSNRASQTREDIYSLVLAVLELRSRLAVLEGKQLAHDRQVTPARTSDYIPWEHIHKDFKFFARDKNGAVKVGPIRPQKRGGFWHFVDCHSIDATCFAGFKIGNTPWDESLQVRAED